MTSAQIHASVTKGKITAELDKAVAATEFEHPLEWIGDATKLAGYMANARKGELQAVVTVSDDEVSTRLVIEVGPVLT